MKLVALGVMAALLAGCAPVIRTHGYVPVPEALDRIEVGIDTRGSVQSKIGRPSATSAFDDEGWYYVSSVVEHFAFYEPEIVDRTVVAVTFDANDVVTGINRYGLADGRVVDLATNATPTYGRQLTIVEQILGNIGAATGSDLFGE